MNGVTLYANATLMNYSLQSSAESCALSDVQGGEAGVQTIIHEMQKRSTNFGYGLGVALGRAIGPDSPSLLHSLTSSISGIIWNKIQCAWAFTTQNAQLLTSKCRNWAITPEKLKRIEVFHLSTQDVIEAIEPTFYQVYGKMQYDQLPSSIDQEIEAQIRFLAEKIDAECKVARNSHKPVLILIGERHRSLHSLLQEMLILRVAQQKLTLGIVFTEMPHFHSIAWPGVSKTRIWDIYTLECALSYLGLKKIPMDMDPPPSNNEGLLTNLFVDEFKLYRVVERNNYMANVIAESPSQDYVAIAGAGHLWGLIKETPLAEKYHIIPINTDPEDRSFILDSRVELTYPKNSSEVVQATRSLFTGSAPTFLSPNLLLKLARLAP